MEGENIFSTPKCTSTKMSTTINYLLMKAFMDENFLKPLPVQRRILEIPDRKLQHIFVNAPGKTGKTTAILTVIINKLLKITKHIGPYAIIVVPTYNHATKTFDLAQRLSKYCPSVKMDLAVKDRELETKLEDLDILIGTPEIVLQLLKDNELRHTKYLVFDDIDKFRFEKVFILIKDCLPSLFNLILTFGMKTEFVGQVIVDHRLSSEVIETPLENSEIHPVNQLFVVCNNLKDKVDVLVDLQDCKHYPGQTVVVCETKELLEDVSRMLKNTGSSINFQGLYEARPETEKGMIMTMFESEIISMLLVTPSFLDIISFQNVSILVNFDQILGELPFHVNLEVYKIRRNLLKGNKNMMVNIIDKTYQQYVFQGSKVVAGEIIFNCPEGIHFEKIASV